MGFVFTQIDSLGRSVTRNLEYSLRILLLTYCSLRVVLVDRAQGARTIFSVVSSQIYFTGWQAMPLMSVLAIGTGSLVILQGLHNLNVLGGSAMIGKLLVMVIVRELGPLLTALVVVARSGTAVASEVGNMRANREISALESMGINPLSYIVFPRLVGGVISVVCLAVYFTVMALIGGFVVTRIMHGVPLQFYIDSLAMAFASEDVWLFLLKNVASGMIIFGISCYQGLSVKHSPTEVPVMTTEAVVKSIIYVVIFNFSVTALFYLNEISKLGVFG